MTQKEAKGFSIGAMIGQQLKAMGVEPVKFKPKAVKNALGNKSSFLSIYADGVVPGSEGRGYVLRRIIRRAIRHGYKLGVEKPFFHKLVKSVELEMGEAHPSLRERRAHVERVLLQEEERFAETLSKGLALRTARVLGQIRAGCSVVRCPVDHPRFPNLPVVIFPGNVGGDEALSEVYRILTGPVGAGNSTSS